MLGGLASVVFERGADGRVTVASYELEPLVCHFDATGTAVYFLSDYSDELAAAHFLSANGASLSLDYLQTLWNEATDPPAIPSETIPTR